MEDRNDPTDAAIVDQWLPYVEPQECEAALRLADSMLQAGLITRSEAREWSVRLRAWKLAHVMEPIAEA